MNNSNAFACFLGIMINHINVNGKVDDALLCKELATFIHNNTKTIGYYGSALMDFIYEYGEDCDETYMGRDSEGEKVYHTFNPDTNWHERIRKELAAMGHYKPMVTA
jgi:hypothetical protein